MNKEKTFYWRRRLVAAAAARAHGAIDNLQVACCKLADRARKADGPRMAERLVHASQHLDMALAELAALENDQRDAERTEIMKRRAERRAALTIDAIDGRVEYQGRSS